MKPYYEDDQVTLWHGDALTVLRELPDASVDCCVTSPPYYALRDYGVTPTEWPEMSYAPMLGLPEFVVPAMSVPLGLEPDPFAYIGHLVLILREVRRVLADHGTTWWNLGDSYYSGRGAPKGSHPKQPAGRGFTRPLDKGGAAWAKPKDLLAIPSRFALAAQADGWYFRSDVIWAKPDPMPANVKDRPTSSHEHIVMLAKNRRYYYNAEAIAETATGQSFGNGFVRPESISSGIRGQEGGWEGRPQLRRALQIAAEKGLTEDHFAAIRAVGMNDAGKAVRVQSGAGKNSPEMTRLAVEAKTALGGYYREFLTGATKNRRDVWTIASQPFPGSHSATFPPTLPERCILAGSPGVGEGRDGMDRVSPAVILDPFSGSGTTGFSAARHGRRYVGIDASRDSLDESLRTRLGQTALLDGGVA